MRHAKILVVEDDPDIMRIILHTLKGAGHQVIPAYGGEDAVRKLQGQRFDLVLTDLAMPKVSGVQVIDAVKGDPETRHIPVIAVTAFVWEALAQSAGQAGCDGYISKPFTPKQLLQEIEKYLPP
jgi:two-component system, cell cycle response regulator DivK